MPADHDDDEFGIQLEWPSGGDEASGADHGGHGPADDGHGLEVRWPAPPGTTAAEPRSGADDPDRTAPWGIPIQPPSAGPDAEPVHDHGHDRDHRSEAGPAVGDEDDELDGPIDDGFDDLEPSDAAPAVGLFDPEETTLGARSPFASTMPAGDFDGGPGAFSDGDLDDAPDLATVSDLDLDLDDAADELEALDGTDLGDADLDHGDLDEAHTDLDDDDVSDLDDDDFDAAEAEAPGEVGTGLLHTGEHRFDLSDLHRSSTGEAPRPLPLLPAMAERIEGLHGALAALGLRVDALSSSSNTFRTAISERLSDHVEAMARLAHGQAQDLEDHQAANDRTVAELRRSTLDVEALLHGVSDQLDAVVQELATLTATVGALDEAGDESDEGDDPDAPTPTLVDRLVRSVDEATAAATEQLEAALQEHRSVGDDLQAAAAKLDELAGEAGALVADRTEVTAALDAVRAEVESLAAGTGEAHEAVVAALGEAEVRLAEVVAGVGEAVVVPPDRTDEVLVALGEAEARLAEVALPDRTDEVLVALGEAEARLAEVALPDRTDEVLVALGEAEARLAEVALPDRSEEVLGALDALATRVAGLAQRPPATATDPGRAEALLASVAGLLDEVQSNVIEAVSAAAPHPVASVEQTSIEAVLQRIAAVERNLTTRLDQVAEVPAAALASSAGDADLHEAVDELLEAAATLTSAGQAGPDTDQVAQLREELHTELAGLRGELTLLRRRIGVRASAPAVLTDDQVEALVEAVAARVAAPAPAVALGPDDLATIAEAVARRLTGSSATPARRTRAAAGTAAEPAPARQVTKRAAVKKAAAKTAAPTKAARSRATTRRGPAEP